jgi:hypothetical protein
MIAALILLAWASLADAVTTVIALRLPGLREANPLARGVMAVAGVPGWVILRLGAAGLAGWALWSAQGAGGPGAALATAGAWVLALITLRVAVANTRLILARRSS